MPARTAAPHAGPESNEQPSQQQSAKTPVAVQIERFGGQYHAHCAAADQAGEEERTPEQVPRYWVRGHAYHDPCDASNPAVQQEHCRCTESDQNPTHE